MRQGDWLGFSALDATAERACETTGATAAGGSAAVLETVDATAERGSSAFGEAVGATAARGGDETGATAAGGPGVGEGSCRQTRRRDGWGWLGFDGRIFCMPPYRREGGGSNGAFSES